MSDHPTRTREEAAPGGRRSALDWVAETVGNDALLNELRSRTRRRRRRRALFASGAVAALIVCFATLRPVPRGAAEVAPSSELQVLVPQQQVLPDGSLAELREGARIEVDFSGPQRRITLLQGEAHFAVQKDPARPFIVQAQGVEVRAVGTAFAVQLASRGIEVLVTEGRVAVDHTAAVATRTPDTAPLAYVAAGEGTVVAPPATPDQPPPPPQVAAIDEVEMTEKLSWRVPRLELSGTPLDVAVEAFNRHSKVKLVIGDPALARLQVSGIVRADQAEALVNLLAANYDVMIEARGSEAVLRRRTR